MMQNHAASPYYLCQNIWKFNNILSILLRLMKECNKMAYYNHLQNLHTHTTYCDGINTPEQIILTAIDKGFGSIGFSGHSYMYYSEGHSMSLEGTEKYKAEISRLKNKYRDQIDIFCGLEFDMYSEIELKGYDYLIGPVHYLKCDDKLVGFDRSDKEVKNVIDTYFDGDGMKYARAYYQTLAELPNHGDFDIIGHFDIISKHSENVKFFDETADKYKSLILEAADALRGRIPIFEVNTGAIARGYRTTPYPSIFIMKELKNMGFGVCITSDCHDVRYLECGFSDGSELLRECGFREKFILTECGFVSVCGNYTVNMIGAEKPFLRTTIRS